jgi:hypothetical protein
VRFSKVMAGVVAFICVGSTANAGTTLSAKPLVDTSHLGEVHFRLSCKPAVQKSFDTAVALLHSFQYDEAGQAFGNIAARDPHCAMAYWGKAMSLYEQLWNFPSAAQLKTGHEYIQKAQQIGSPTGRERGYVEAVAAFFQDNPKLSHDARIGAYSNAMEQLYKRDPTDVNAGAFYALSLVALAQDGVQEMANRRHAIALLDTLFQDHPDNPGVDHYLIHASDSPALAQYGLAAARNYARIAPDSAHALHMPSHIFTRLGYWQESIQSNLASSAAAQLATKSGRDNESAYQLHALTFLEYAYLQSGQDADARRVIAELPAVPGDSRTDLAEDQALFHATYDLETHQWKSASALALPAGDPYPRDKVEIYWTRTVGAARSGDPADARRDFRKLIGAYTAARAEMKRHGYQSSEGESVGQMEAAAWMQDAEGHHGQAMKMMRSAVEKEGPDGVDVLGMPAQEMLGDLLLAHNKASAALAAYKEALKESPNRFDGLYGAARAAELAGHPEEAQSYYAELVKICGPRADRSELDKARVYLAKK